MTKKNIQVNILNNQKIWKITKEIKQIVKNVAVECATSCNMDRDYCVSIVFTDDEGIREYNRDYRNIDNSTDVLSFTVMEKDPEDNITYLGDIIISIETAYRQAEEYGHSPEREIAFLTSHGMFHLFGFDHIDEKSLEEMTGRQEDVLKALGYTRIPKNSEPGEFVNLALEAMSDSYSPYSQFRVGSCIVTSDGSVYTGCNVENASYGATICAERTATLKAVSDGHRKIKLVVVCGDDDKPVVPCGICLQFLNEFASSDMKIICCDRTGSKREVYTLDELMPRRFGGEKV